MTLPAASPQPNAAMQSFAEWSGLDMAEDRAHLKAIDRTKAPLDAEHRKNITAGDKLPSVYQ